VIEEILLRFFKESKILHLVHKPGNELTNYLPGECFVEVVLNPVLQTVVISLFGQPAPHNSGYIHILVIQEDHSWAGGFKYSIKMIC